MMRICSLFDKYRDGELSLIQEEEFRSHMARCEDCRARISLLNNLALILKKDPAFLQTDLSVRIAQMAFQRNRTWDAILLGWLRPGPALAALSLVGVLFSILWIIPNYQPTNAFAEYERLITTVNSVNMDTSISQLQSDTELAVWLETEVMSR